MPTLADSRGSGSGSQDGLILDINLTDLGNANTSFTYFLLGAAGYNSFSMDHLITATTLTYEATNDELDQYVDEASELIVAVNDRTFAGAGNWTGSGGGSSVVVNAGGLDVTVGNADTGALLLRDFMTAIVTSATVPGTRGFQNGRRYTVTLDISALSGGTVTVSLGNQVIATGLTDGAAQTITFQANQFGDRLVVTGTLAAATFTLDDMSILEVAARWTDITLMLTDGTATDFTITGFLSINVAIPWARMRVRRVTTNATNALELRLHRMTQ